MAYLNGKFTCFDPTMIMLEDNLAIAMNGSYSDLFISNATRITSGVFSNGWKTLRLPECRELAFHSILDAGGAVELYLPKVETMADNAMVILSTITLQLGSEGNGLIWSQIDPNENLAGNVYCLLLTAYLDETQADYLDFADYLLSMADEVELYDSNGNPLEV